ncbi:MAG: hypothetical protein EBZ77_03730 [Chitinophagia bacterium]|nr:hypothetical protein [Chitinophagia bacterium]
MTATLGVVAAGITLVAGSETTVAVTFADADGSPVVPTTTHVRSSSAVAALDASVSNGTFKVTPLASASQTGIGLEFIVSPTRRRIAVSIPSSAILVWPDGPVSAPTGTATVGSASAMSVALSGSVPSTVRASFGPLAALDLTSGASVSDVAVAGAQVAYKLTATSSTTYTAALTLSVGTAPAKVYTRTYSVVVLQKAGATYSWPSGLAVASIPAAMTAGSTYSSVRLTVQGSTTSTVAASGAVKVYVGNVEVPGSVAAYTYESGTVAVTSVTLGAQTGSIRFGVTVGAPTGQTREILSSTALTVIAAPVVAAPVVVPVVTAPVPEIGLRVVLAVPGMGSRTYAVPTVTATVRVAGASTTTLAVGRAYVRCVTLTSSAPIVAVRTAPSGQVLETRPSEGGVMLESVTVSAAGEVRFYATVSVDGTTVEVPTEGHEAREVPDTATVAANNTLVLSSSSGSALGGMCAGATHRLVCTGGTLGTTLVGDRRVAYTVGADAAAFVVTNGDTLTPVLVVDDGTTANASSSSTTNSSSSSSSEEWAWTGIAVEANGARFVRVAPTGAPSEGESYAIRASVSSGSGSSSELVGSARVSSATRRSVTRTAELEPANGTGPWRVRLEGFRCVVAPSVPSGLTCAIDDGDLLVALVVDTSASPASLASTTTYPDVVLHDVDCDEETAAEAVKCTVTFADPRNTAIVVSKLLLSDAELEVGLAYGANAGAWVSVRTRAQSPVVSCTFDGAAVATTVVYVAARKYHAVRLGTITVARTQTNAALVLTVDGAATKIATSIHELVAAPTVRVPAYSGDQLVVYDAAWSEAECTGGTARASGPSSRRRRPPCSPSAAP